MRHDHETAHLAIYEGLTDSEVGHLLVELHTGRFTGTSFDVVTVAESRTPITTMGGLRLVPDALLAELEPADSRLLILPGAEIWGEGLFHRGDLAAFPVLMHVRGASTI